MKQKRIVHTIGYILFSMIFIIISAQAVSASASELKEKDFEYTSSGYKMHFMDDEYYGCVRSLNRKTEKTYRGIKVGSKLKTVRSKYGNSPKKKFDTKESFNKYIRQYYFEYGLHITKWKYYVEYTYKKNTKEDRRFRFYLDKNDKVVTILYIYGIKALKLTNKTVNIGFSFQAPAGKKITTKTVAGKRVQVIPPKTKLKFKNSKLNGILMEISMYDKRGRCANTYSINPANYKSGVEIERIFENTLTRWHPVTGKYEGVVDLNNLGNYYYFVITVYDVSHEGGGHDKPAHYYFRLK